MVAPPPWNTALCRLDCCPDGRFEIVGETKCRAGSGHCIARPVCVIQTPHPNQQHAHGPTCHRERPHLTPTSACTLQAAEALVERAGSGAAAAMYQDALQLVRKSSCNCYAFEASSDDSLETRVRARPSPPVALL